MTSSRNKVVWYEGMTLDPQHFQQWDCYHEDRIDARIRGLSRLGWGFTDLAAAYTAQIGAFTRALAAKEQSPFVADDQLIDTVRRRLLNFTALSPYDRIRAEGLSAFRPLPLSELVPREHAALFEGAPEVPGLFTIAGWTTFMKDRIEANLSSFAPGLRRHLFEAPITRTWTDLVATAQTHLNRRRREDVSQPYDIRLSRLYPFAPNAAMDASLIDVETFLAPDTGTLDAFIQTELRPFFDVERGRARTWRGTGLSFSAETTRLFTQVDRLQSELFDGGVIHLPFEMRPEHPERSANAPLVARIRIHLHGIVDTYTLGQPYWFEAVWPGRPDAGLSIDGRDLSLPDKQYAGDWALLRLLQDARIQRAGQTQSSVQWTFEEPDRYTIAVLYDLRARRGMNVFVNPTGFFRLSVPSTLNAPAP